MCAHNLNFKKRAFILSEVLVAVLVVGLLALVIATVLTYIRKQASDSKRINEVRQMQGVLELYYDKNAFYPTSINDLVSEGFIKTIPTLPLGTNQVLLKYVPLGFSSICTGYHLGITLETNYKGYLDKDADSDPGTVCQLSKIADFDGKALLCEGVEGDGGANKDTCYDVLVEP